MIELHDATGSSNVQDLLNCAQWFKTNIGLFNKYQKYILINIANEWVRTTKFILFSPYNELKAF